MPNTKFAFEIIKRSRKSGARLGVLHTAHGSLKTPAFVAVATNGALKHVTWRQAEETGCELVFCNTAHFLTNADCAQIQLMGGLHALLGRRTKPLITDSSGFQVFSWGNELVIKVDKQTGITFKSYRDGRLFNVSPESCIRTQTQLGADIILVLDELLGMDGSSRERTEQSLTLCESWADRCLSEHERLGGFNTATQALFGIVHGGYFTDLRVRSAKFLAARPFDGFALGGSLGKGPASGNDQARDAIAAALCELPDCKPRHLLGIGDLPSIRAAVPFGIDTFDSSFPTMIGRHGSAICGFDTPLLRIRESKFAAMHSRPVDESCDCETCRSCSLSYLHHLYKCNEPVLATLLAVHNLTAMHRCFATIREEIANDSL